MSYLVVRIKRIAKSIKKLKKMEISRRNLGENVFSYFLNYFRIYILRMIKIRIQRKGYSFVSTNIETFGTCNRECHFCFNHDRFAQREKGIMDEQVWEKIINELSSHKFCGRISPHFYGEPLLDKRLPDLLNYARKKCPDSYIMIATNGDYLNEDLFLKLIKSGVNFISVTNYDDEENLGLNKLEKKYPGHIKIRGYKDSIKTDRSGDIFKRGNTLETPCLRPTGQLVINWKGEVLLCCMDYYAKVTFGNVKQQKIIDIWNNADFNKYRNQLQLGKRSEYPLCKNCDDIGHIPW